MKISIVTVCYNSVKTIEQTILSVLEQPFHDKEYIIMDGGSTDGTQDVIQRYEAKIAYWESVPDDGIYDAMNKGILRATGDVIALLNSDDWYEADVLRKVEQYFRKSNADIIVGEVNHVMNGRVFKRQKRKFDAEDIHLKMLYPHPAMFVKREVYTRVGNFHTQYKISADYEWTLRAHNMGIKIQCVPDIFVNFRLSGISTTQAYKCHIENREIALRNMGEHRKEACRERIEEYYKHVLERNKYDYFYQTVWRTELDYIKTLLDFSSKYYIWGTGYYGELCYELFFELGVRIAGFIDNHVQQKRLHNVNVITPEEIPFDGIICISTQKYEQEIKEQIQSLPNSNVEYICFSDIQREIYQNLNADGKGNV